VTVLRSSELVGRVVGGRYRLLRAVGSGASAHVYVAEDVRLRRRVALKVLHPALAEDKAFLRRFQAEAQTVAALRHPGIVRVYDWGEDNGAAYLAMELLEGGNLRALLDGGHRLSVSQAAALGLDIAAALAYAHSRGLVHRDIKPANLLFDEDGHASVADFGIARALAEASWTEPMGLVGTARYAAPEQLKGVPLDGRADVYALALVLVESVTGKVPFARDTALGALLARTDRPLPVPVELGPLVPVLEQAGTADPERRLSAESVAHAIASVARCLRAPARLALPGLAVLDARDVAEPTEPGRGGRKPVDAGLSILVGDIAVVVPGSADVPAPSTAPVPAVVGDIAGSPADAAPPGPKDPAVVPEDSGSNPNAPPSGPGAGPGSVADQEPGRPAPNASDGPARYRRAGKHRRGRRWLRRLSLVSVIVVLAGAGVAAGLYLSRPAPTYAVPDVGGDSVAVARGLVGTEHLVLAIVARQWSSTASRGLVVSQVPLAGTRLLAKQTVSVTVSLGPEPVAVPPLATFDLTQATSVLESAGLRLGKVARQTSWTVPDGVVISWSGKGHKLLPNSAVSVVVSVGKPMATVPSLVTGTTYARAEALLARLGFRVHEEEYYRDTVPAGVVLSTSPAPGMALVVGTTVTVNVSAGPHLVTIPNSVVGLNAVQAAKLLAGLGIYVSPQIQGSLLGTVTATQPAVGTAVLYHSSIVLVTG